MSNLDAMEVVARDLANDWPGFQDLDALADTFDPPTVLALIARIRELEAAIVETAWAFEGGEALGWRNAAIKGIRELASQIAARPHD